MSNLANLNIQVTSNIQAVQQSLRTLQTQLSNLRSTNMNINTSVLQRSMGNINTQMTGLSRSASGLISSFGGLNAITGDFSTNIKSSTSGLTNLVAGLFLAERAGERLRGVFTRANRAVQTMSAATFERLYSEVNIPDFLLARSPRKYNKEVQKIINSSVEDNLNQYKQTKGKFLSEDLKQTSQAIASSLGNLKNKLSNFIKVDASSLPMFSQMIDRGVNNAVQKAYAKLKVTKAILSRQRDTLRSLPQDSPEGVSILSDEEVRPLERNIERLKVSLEVLKRKFSKLREGAMGLKASLMGLTQILAGLGVKLVLLGGAIQLTTSIIKIGIFKKVIEEGVRFNSILEQITTSYRVLIGSEEEFKGFSLTSPERFKAAEDLVSRIQDFASFTPLLTKNLAESGQILMKFGVDSNTMLPLLRDLGEITGGDAERMSRMALAVGQSISMGRLTGTDRLQMVSAGFNPVKYIAENMGISPKEVEEAISRGEIGADKLLKAISTAAKTDFLGFMEEQSKTLAGRMSTLTDIWQIFTGKVAQPISIGLKSALEYVIKGFMYLTQDKTLKNIEIQINTYVIPAFRELGTTLMWILNLKGNMDMKDEATSTIKSVGAIIQTTSMLAKILYSVALVSGIAWRSFAAGIKTVVLLVTGLIEGVKNFASNANLSVEFAIAGFEFLGGTIKSVLYGIYYDGQWAIGGLIHLFGKATNAGIGFHNTLIRGQNIARKAAGLEEIPLVERLNIEEYGKGLMDKSRAGLKAADANNIGYKSAKEAFEKGMEIFDPDKWIFTTTAFDILKKDTDDLTTKFKQLLNLGDLFGGKQLVEDLLKDLDKMESGKAPDFGEVDWTKFASKLEDAVEEAKKLADAMRTVQLEITNSLNSIVNFGNVFERLTYERFSPAKLLSRIRRFFKEISGWTANLAALEGKVSDSVLNELRNMGISGFGITSALTRAKPEQLEEINALYKGSRLEALNTVVKTIQFEHSGLILVKGVDSLGQLKGIVSMIAKDIAEDKRLISTEPALADIFR